MLFPYTFVPHQMDKMQKFIDYIFHEVWCRAPSNPTFSFDLFDGNSDLKEVMEAFHYSDAKGADFFNGHVERIHQLFVTLTEAEIEQFRLWYQANNEIEKVCANDPSTHIARYAQINTVHETLAKQLASFFKGLYSQTLLDLAVLRGKIGDIDSHYHTFMEQNNSGKCPFCGIADMQGIYHSKREAYDHYLPKALYPFNSINFRNLVPACHHCNSSYKTSKDPAFTPKDPCNLARRRKVFYPYSGQPHPIDITITINNSDVSNLSPEEIEIEFDSAGYTEEVETWKDIYGVEERYKAKCCSESDGKYWLAQVLDEWHEDERSPSDFLRTLRRQAKNSPLADTNFLKMAFLEACDQAGIFSAHSTASLPCYPKQHTLAGMTS